MAYVDGFVLPVPKKNLPAYQALAEKVSKIWMEHGALEYRECVLEDGNLPVGIPFRTAAQCGPDETVVFAYIRYNSRAHRDEVNARIAADERLSHLCSGDILPFDLSKMVWGGFETIVEA